MSSTKEELEMEGRLLKLALDNDSFLHGHCAALAVELQKILGGKIVAILDEDDDVTCLVHAFVQIDDLRGVDLNGLRSVKDIVDEFEDLAWEPWLQETTATEVTAINYGEDGVDAETATQAKRLAEQIVRLLAPLSKDPKVERTVRRRR